MGQLVEWPAFGMVAFGNYWRGRQDRGGCGRQVEGRLRLGRRGLAGQEGQDVRLGHRCGMGCVGVVFRLDMVLTGSKAGRDTAAAVADPGLRALVVCSLLPWAPWLHRC